jgi:hypothetical protein
VGKDTFKKMTLDDRQAASGPSIDAMTAPAATFAKKLRPSAT